MDDYCVGDVHAYLTCEQCGLKMIRTSRQYWSCPEGHGKLVQVLTENYVMDRRRKPELKVVCD